MDCKEVEELLVPYLLGTLDSPDRDVLSAHLDSCPGCGFKLDGEGEILTRLAFSVPQRHVPPQVKQRLLSRIEADSFFRTFSRVLLRRSVEGLRLLAGNVPRFPIPDPSAFLTQTTRAAASVLVLAFILGGVWFNARMNHNSNEERRLAEEIENAAQEGAGEPSFARGNNPAGQRQDGASSQGQVIDVLRMQPYLSYEAMRMSGTPGTSVNMLWGTGWTAGARGMMMVSRTGAEALLLAINLPPLPPDKVYQVWLIRDGQRFNGGLFTVDSTGYGQTVIIPYVSIAEFEAIRITIEPAGGSIDPTGTSVLGGDL